MGRRAENPHGPMCNSREYVGGVCDCDLADEARDREIASAHARGIAEGRRQMAEEAAAIAAEHCGPRRSWEGMSGALTRIRALVPR